MPKLMDLPPRAEKQTTFPSKGSEALLKCQPCTRPHTPRGRASPPLRAGTPRSPGDPPLRSPKSHKALRRAWHEASASTTLVSDLETGAELVQRLLGETQGKQNEAPGCPVLRRTPQKKPRRRQRRALGGSTRDGARSPRQRPQLRCPHARRRGARGVGGG